MASAGRWPPQTGRCSKCSPDGFGAQSPTWLLCDRHSAMAASRCAADCVRAAKSKTAATAADWTAGCGVRSRSSACCSDICSSLHRVGKV